jgi:hypothetical protein
LLAILTGHVEKLLDHHAHPNPENREQSDPRQDFEKVYGVLVTIGNHFVSFREIHFILSLDSGCAFNIELTLLQSFMCFTLLLPPYHPPMVCRIIDNIKKGPFP